MILALIAGIGTYYLWTAVALEWSGLGLGPKTTIGDRRSKDTWQRWLTEAGLAHVRPAEFAGATIVVAATAAAMAFAVFGSALPAVLTGSAASTIPIAIHRQRRTARLHAAREAWPRVIDEVRIMTGSAGRSVPQALFDAGRRAPAELRWPFEVAQREWLLTTDFQRTTSLLKRLLADPAADAVCETLLVAHEVGGSDLDRRLEALAADRTTEVEANRRALAEQAGVRFARRFVLLVPAGMAAAGMAIGPGRGAYQEPGGQLAVVVGLIVVVACWIWAGRLMRLPDPRRVLVR